MAKILLVDDDETLLRVVADYLRAQGHQVETCAEAERAAEAAEAAAPDLAIVDYEMPRLKGTDLLTELRRRPATGALPVVFLSGVEAMQYASQVPSDPKVRFLRKPADFDQLDLALLALLGPGSGPAGR
jgi:CheY-like chemotaxis protein